MYSSSKSDASEETVSECVFADTLQEQSQKNQKFSYGTRYWSKAWELLEL